MIHIYLPFQPCLSFSSADFCDVRRLQQFLLSGMLSTTLIFFIQRKFLCFAPKVSLRYPFNIKIQLSSEHIWLTAVSAKDVSLLITFRKVENAEKEDELGPLPSINLEGKLYRVMVSVIDLDPKPINRIGRWLKQKDEMLETFKQLQIVPYNSK